MSAPLAPKDELLNPDERERLFTRLGENRLFAQKLAKVRDGKKTGELKGPEFDAERHLLTRLRADGKFPAETQQQIAAALGIDLAALWAYLRPVAPEVLRAYLDWLIKDCAPLRLNAINQNAAKPGSEPIGLASVYVDLNLSLLLPARLSYADCLKAGRIDAHELGQLMDPQREMRQSVKEARRVAVLEAVANHEKMVLLGAPGSGKSTVTAVVALSLAEAATGKPDALKRLGPWWQFGTLLPVRVVLRQFAAHLQKLKVEQGRAAHLWDFIQHDLTQAGLPPASAAAPRQIAQQTGAIFLFDGLDEAREETTRARVLEAVAEFTRTAGPRCRFLLTARPYAWEAFKGSPTGPGDQTPAQLAGMPTALQLADFEPEQSQTFITRWYEALQAAGWITNAADITRKTAELKQAIKRDDLAPLARNPLLLTLMATLHSNRTHLPDDRADLYQEVVELLLQRWNENIGADRGLLDTLGIPTLTLPHIRKVIQKLAFKVHGDHLGREGVADIPAGDLKAALNPLLNRSDDNAQLVLDYIEKRAGLLMNQGKRGEGLQDQYTFPHRTFQEFLAACHLAGLATFCADCVRLARENPKHWREVLILAARRAEADRGVPVADTLVHRQDFELWTKDHSVQEADWRAAILAGEQLLEIGLAAVNGDETHVVVRDRVAGWLAALLAAGVLPVQDRAQAGILLGKLGDLRPGVGLKKHGLPDLDFLPALPKQTKFKLGETDTVLAIKQDYRLSRYLVTVAQYAAFVDADGYGETGKSFWSPEGWEWRAGNGITGPEDYGSVFQTPNHPRVGVCWYEAEAFCNWLTLKLGSSRREEAPASESESDGASSPRLLPGEVIRLPTEAEWEQAARWNGKPGKQGAADGRKFPWGPEEKDLAEQCNCSLTGLGHTSAVGLFPKGVAKCGAADLSGNVWEWCENWYDDKDEKYRVVRGGSWGNGGPDGLSSSFRVDDRPVGRYRYVGFRVVRVGGGSG